MLLLLVSYYIVFHPHYCLLTNFFGCDFDDELFGVGLQMLLCKDVFVGIVRSGVMRRITAD